MASDRSIGGFGHTWGADLLEKEGVVFEEDGKIHPHCFVNEVSVVASASVSSVTTKSSSAAKRSKKRKRGDDDSTTNNESTNKTDIYFNGTISISETSLKQEILNLLGKRQPGKTC